jgi:hypothetical protein
VSSKGNFQKNIAKYIFRLGCARVSLKAFPAEFFYKQTSIFNNQRGFSLIEMLLLAGIYKTRFIPTLLIPRSALHHVPIQYSHAQSVRISNNRTANIFTKSY